MRTIHFTHLSLVVVAHACMRKEQTPETQVHRDDGSLCARPFFYGVLLRARRNAKQQCGQNGRTGRAAEAGEQPKREAWSREQSNNGIYQQCLIR